MKEKVVVLLVVRGGRNFGGTGELLRIITASVILVSAVGRQRFPQWCFQLVGASPGSGEEGITKGRFASFAKTCFETAVGVWSAKTGEKTRFSLRLLGFLDLFTGAHNPEVVGSSPASATKKPPFSPRKRWFF